MKGSVGFRLAFALSGGEWPPSSTRARPRHLSRSPLPKPPSMAMLPDCCPAAGTRPVADGAGEGGLLLTCADGWWAWQVLNLRPLPCEEANPLLSRTENALTCAVVLATCLAGA
jgi:hypothetical protein